MHPAKNYLKKLYSPNPKCSLGCNSDEDKRHIFEQCEVLKSHSYINLYDNIFQDSTKQKEALSVFIMLEERRKKKRTFSPASRLVNMYI